MTEVTISIAASAKDGHITRENVPNAWPPTGAITADTTSATNYAIFMRKVRHSTFGFSEASVGALIFDTSGIPDSATITAATLRAVIGDRGVQGSLARTLDFEWYDFAGSIDTADWTENLASASAGSVPFATWSAWTISASQDIALSNPNANINKSGETGLRIAFSSGDPGASGVQDNICTFYSLEHATQAEPKLIVTYTEGSPQNANVSGKTSAAAFGAVGVTPGGVLIPVSGLGSAAAFGAVGASSGGILVDVAGLGSAAQFGSVAPLAGNRNVDVAGLGSAAAFGSVDTDAMAYANVPGLTSAAQFGSVGTTVGGVNVPVSGLESAAQFGSVSTTGGAAPTDLNPAARGYYF